MPSIKTLPPTLFLRSGYCIDTLKLRSGLSFPKLEQRIRKKQYEAKGLCPPSEATIHDYFLLRRSVAFEPKINDRTRAPWLLAVESEFPGSAFAFFHPLFDLLFGKKESEVLWFLHLGKIPEVWIDELRMHGDELLATEWEQMNISLSKRKHRSRPKEIMSRLEFVRLSMMRLPKDIFNLFFEINTQSGSCLRLFNSIEDEISFLRSINSLDAIAGLLALVEEGAEIGDLSRFCAAKNCLTELTPGVRALPGCKRIGISLENQLRRHLAELPFRHAYLHTLHSGFGFPVTWRRGLLMNYFAKDCEEDLQVLTHASSTD